MKNYIAMDTGGTFIKYGLIREDGVFLDKGKLPTPQTSFSDYLDVVRMICERYSDCSAKNILSMSLPGTVRQAEGTIGGQSSLYYIHNVMFREAVEEITGMMVMMENDANCAALGETWLGCARNCNSAAFLIFGTGLGGALVTNKQLYRGAHLAAGEFSDIISDYDRESGTVRNVDVILSTRKAAAEIAAKTGIDIQELNGEVICRKAMDGLQPYADAMDRICLETAVLVFNIQHIFDPECIVLGGGMSGQSLWYDETRKHLDEVYRKTDSFAPVSLLRSTLGNDANLLGALKHTLNSRSNGEE